MSNLFPPKSRLTSSIRSLSRCLSISLVIRSLDFNTEDEPGEGDFECFIICDRLGEDLLALLEEEEEADECLLELLLECLPLLDDDDDDL